MTCAQRLGRRRRASLAVVALIASACSGGGDEGAARAPKPGLAPGGTLTVAIGRPAAIDPALVSEPWGRLVASLLCDPLVQLDPMTGELQPAVATSWIVSNGGRQITLKLRKGVRFHDGSSMSVDDVAFTMSRVASQELGSPAATVLRPVVGWAQIHGDEEPSTPEAATALIGVRVAGSDAIQISLSEPRADFTRVLTLALSSPVPRAGVNRDPAAFESKPVCAGPYMLERPWKPADEEIALVRFPGYHGGNRGFTRGGRGWADRIVLRVLADPASAGAGVDLMPAPATRTAPAGLLLAAGSLPYLEYLALPVTTPPFDRREVRLALSRALDRNALAGIYGGTRAPANGFLPPGLGSPARRDACPAAPSSAEAASARQAIAAAGLAGSEIRLAYNPDFRNAALMEAVAAAWRANLGLRVRLVSVPWERYLETVGDVERPANEAGPFRLGWEPAYPGPDAVLAPLFASSSIGTENLSRFADPRFDRLLDRTARRAGNEEDLRDAYQRLEDVVCEQMPAIPLLFGRTRWLVGDGVEAAAGDVLDRYWGTPTLRELAVRE